MTTTTPANAPHRFEMSTDGCDEVLQIYRRRAKGRPITIRYWTRNGVSGGLTHWFRKHPDLRVSCQLLLARFEAKLVSDDEYVRASAQREIEIIEGLRMALADR